MLVVTDEGIVRSGIAAHLEAVLEQNNIAYVIYAETRPNPTVQNVEQALALYRQENCQALIAIGGGSSMDCAKAVGARVARPRTPMGMLKGTLRILKKIPTLIAIPTTAGTGSEVTLAAVIIDAEKQHKYVMNDFVLIPRYAVLDASLTHSLPPHLTATTGMDALTHAVEAYIGRSTTRETREKALEATRKCGMRLPQRPGQHCPGKYAHRCLPGRRGLLPILCRLYPRHRPLSWRPIQHPPWACQRGDHALCTGGLRRMRP